MEDLLRLYGIYPNKVEDLGNVYKVHTSSGIFALKETKKRRHIKAVEGAAQFQFEGAIPLYATKSGMAFVSQNDRYYYVMPWLHDSEKNESDFLQSLAEWHKRTLSEHTWTEEELTTFYEKLKQEWEQKRIFIENFVRICEDTEYMSPASLQICMYHHEIMKALEFANKRLTDWYEKAKETKKIRISFVHGNPSMTHYVSDNERNYLLNFEQAHYAPPCMDLYRFFRTKFHYYPKENETLLQWLKSYESIMTLEGERSLFLAYTAFPEELYKEIKMYANGRKNEFTSTVDLQRMYFVMKNAEYFVVNVEKVEKESQELQ